MDEAATTVMNDESSLVALSPSERNSRYLT